MAFVLMTLQGGALGKRQIFGAWFMPRDVCYISWEEDSRSGLSSFCLLLQYNSTSKGVVLIGSCRTGWLLGGGVHPRSSLSYISHRDAIGLQ